MANCPVCQTEYTENTMNFCRNCGWDLAPYPLTFTDQIPEVFLQKERTKLTWARGAWSHLKLQSKLSNIEIRLQADTQERTQFKLQLQQLASQLEQVSAASPSSQSLELTVQKERDELKIQLAQSYELITQIKDQLETANRELAAWESSSDVLDLLIKGLSDPSEQVQRVAYQLLKQSPNPKAQKAINEQKPYRLFKPIFTHKNSGAIRSICISPDGKLLASGSGNSKVKVWDLDKGELIRTITGDVGALRAVAIGTDNQTLVGSSDDTTVRVWNLHTGELISTFTGHVGTVWSVAISPDNQIIVSGGSDKLVKVWNRRTEELLRTFSGHSNLVRCVAISPDGRNFISGSDDKTIKIRNLVTGEMIRTLAGHTGLIMSVACSPDGKILASGSGDNTINIWNLENGELIRTLTANSSVVNHIVIAQDGQTLVSANADNTIKIWNLHTGELIHTLTGHINPINSVAISPDGWTIASGSDDKTIQIWGVSV
ncbi:hypothetical protein NIES2101_34080 [Calothrix sp. HK-06]|nr:hypothetical protein NIES2101_34080 [Calothrix sp. HK-06]